MLVRRLGRYGEVALAACALVEEQVEANSASSVAASGVKAISYVRSIAGRAVERSRSVKRVKVA
jgi:hypothetical protein